MDKKAQTIATYDQNARAFANKFDQAGARIEDIKKAFALVKKDSPSVLEIGCGTGRDAAEIIKLTDEYLGVDLSSELIAIAKERIPEASFEVADIENCDLPEDIDIIFAFASLIHMDEEHFEDILVRAHSALTPGGIFLISLKLGPYHEFTRTDNFGVRTYYYYTPGDVARLAGDNYEVILVDHNNLRGQDWFEIILRKAK
ncbi:MAG: class I SAM-dependent methyltransferase [Patescibacteria group bacterium]|jgi:SAM-dependent methyltransferase